MNILIIKLSAIGDVVMSLPFLEALRKTWPEARLTWLVEQAASDIVMDHPALDRVIVSNRKKWMNDLKRGRVIKAFKGIKSFVSELRDQKYDIVVDLQGLLKSGVMVALSRGARKIGFDKTRELSYIVLNEKLEPYDPDKHALKRYLDVAQYLGADAGGIDYLYPFNKDAEAEAYSLLKKNEAESDGGLVVVNPGAKWDTKLWPLDHWKELARLLVEDGNRVVITGGPDERDDNLKISGVTEGIHDLTGETSLKVLAEIFRKADLVVCPDTGPMHLAAAVGTPVIALFGPTAPWRTGPYGKGHVILRTGADCSPCFRKQCGDVHCMSGLTPEIVMESVNKRMELF